MVARVIHLLKSGVEPRRILVLMFNKSAQEEFARRLKRACAEESLPVAEVQTFHGFGLRLAKRMVEAGLLNGAKLETEGYTIRKLAREVLLQVNAESGEDNQLDLNFDVVTEFLDTIDILKGELYPTPDERWAAAWTLVLDTASAAAPPSTRYPAGGTVQMGPRTILFLERR